MNIDSGFGGGGGGGGNRNRKKGGKKKGGKKKGKGGGGNSRGQGNSNGSGSPFGSGNTSGAFGGSAFGGNGGFGGGGSGGGFGGSAWGTTSTASAPFGGQTSRGGGGVSKGGQRGGGTQMLNDVLARVGVNAVTQSPELQVLLVKKKQGYAVIGGPMHRGPEDDLSHVTNEIAATLTVPQGQTAGVPPLVPIGSTEFRSSKFNVYLIRGQQGWEQWMPTTKSSNAFTGQVAVNGKQAAVTGGVLWANWADLLEECRFSFCKDSTNRKKVCNCSSTTCNKVHLDFNRYSGGGQGSPSFGGGFGGGGGGGRLGVFFATSDWFVRHGEAFLKKYQEKIELMSKETLFRFCQGAFKPQSVLHEDDEIQVSIRRGEAAFPRAVMDVAFLNKTTGQRHFAVELKVPSANITGAANGQVPAVLPPNTPAVQSLQFEARAWFGSQEIPGLFIQHAAADSAGGAHSLRMVEVKVPFLVSSFFQPAPVNAAAWNELAASEKKREFRIPADRMTNINLLLQSALHMQVEMSGNCITAAGCVADPKNLCIIVIECQNANQYLMSVRSSIAHIPDVIVNLFSFLDFCSPTELMQ